jgi:copper homeostasis protein
MTPDTALVASLGGQLTIPFRVMIRATEAGFEADETIMEKMIRSIQTIREYPIDGFVIGVMKNNRVDRETILLLLQCAHPFPVTFHKAIDTSEDIRDDLNWLNQFSQIDTLLTSGGALQALEGQNRILEMKDLFQRDIMAAGKIKPGQLPELHKELGLNWYHGREVV